MIKQATALVTLLTRQYHHPRAIFRIKVVLRNVHKYDTLQP